MPFTIVTICLLNIHSDIDCISQILILYTSIIRVLVINLRVRALPISLRRRIYRRSCASLLYKPRLTQHAHVDDPTAITPSQIAPPGRSYVARYLLVRVNVDHCPHHHFPLLAGDGSIAVALDDRAFRVELHITCSKGQTS